jgi:outer membrane protein, heavy metal efflux system
MNPKLKTSLDRVAMIYAKLAFIASILLSQPLLQPGIKAQVYPRQYLEIAVENNPGLKAQLLAFKAAEQQAELASGLPDPEFSAGIYTPPMQRLMGNQLFDAGVMQMFPWFGTLGEKKAAATSLAEASYQQYRSERNNLYLVLTRKWLAMYEKEQQANLINSMRQLLKAREDLIYTRYEAGLQREGLMLDLYRLEIQINGLDNRLDKLAEEKQALLRQFNILLHRDQNSNVQLPDTLQAVVPRELQEEPDRDVLHGSPLVQKSQAQAEAARREQEIARLMTRPMLGVGVQYSHFAPGDAAMGQMDGGAMLMPMISVSLPVYGNKNRAARNRSTFIAEMTVHQMDDQINNLASQWAGLQAIELNLQRDQQFFQRQLDVIYKAWELVLNTYASGKEGFDELLRIQDQLLELEQQLLSSIVNQHINAAEMDRLLARDIFQ